MATEVPREKLKELMEKNGDSLLQDRDRCEGLLKDYCGGHRREISALVGALEERVPLELRSSWQTAMTPEAMRARLVQRLEDNRGLAPEIANYAVDTWSYALGVGLGRSSERVQDLPVPHVNGRWCIGCGTGSRGSPGGLAPGRSPRGSAGRGEGRHEQPEQGGRGWSRFAGSRRHRFALLHHPAPHPRPRRAGMFLRCNTGRTHRIRRLRARTRRIHKRDRTIRPRHRTCRRRRTPGIPPPAPLLSGNVNLQ